MKLGVSTYAYTWAVGVPGSPPASPMDAFAFVREAARLGARVVQFGDNLPLDRLGPDDLLRLRELADAQGISIEVGARGLLDEIVASYLRIARELGSPILRIVTDLGSYCPDEPEIRATLRRMVPMLEAAGIVLAIENHSRIRSGALAQVVRSAQSRYVRICLDTVNSFGALEGPEPVIETLAPLAASLHVKDFSIERVSHTMGFAIEGTPAGKGRLDVPWLLGRLRAHGVDPNAILELWVSPERSLEATIAKEHRWAEESFRYLRTLISE